MFGRICEHLGFLAPSRSDSPPRADDHHVPSSPHLTSTDRSCTLGRECYATAFTVTSCGAALAIVVALGLSSRATMKRRLN